MEKYDSEMVWGLQNHLKQREINWEPKVIDNLPSLLSNYDSYLIELRAEKGIDLEFPFQISKKPEPSLPVEFDND